MYNVFDSVEIICWGDLQNKSKIQKLCSNIIEGHKEEWLSEVDFFNTSIENTKSRYSLLINDKAEIIIPQVYFMKLISIFERFPIVGFAYCDYNNILLPSFKPFLFRDLNNGDGFPIFIRNLKNKLKIDNSENYLSDAAKILSVHLVGFHVAEPLIKIYE